MSDLLLDTTRQPTAIPVLASDGGDYTAPGEDWDGDPVAVALSAGDEAGGLTPNEGLDAETLNDLIGRLGAGLASIVDAPVLTWDRPQDNQGQPNDNHWSASGVSVGRVTVRVAPGWYYSGVSREVLIHPNITKMFLSYDGHNWTDAGAHGVTGGSAMRGVAVGHSVLSSVDYVTIIAWQQDNNGIVRATNNFGSSWYDAGTLGASMESGVRAIGGFFAGRFYIVARSQLYYKAHAAAMTGAWTRIDVSGIWNGAPPPNPSCVETSPTEIAIGVVSSPGVLHSTDGLTFTNTALPSTASDGVGAMQWSESHQLWIITSDSGNRVFTAPAGFGAITERAQITDYQGTVITGLHAVASLGRTVVVAASDGLWVSRDLANWRLLDVVLTDDGVNLDEWTWLQSLNGKLWAGRCIQVGGDSSLEYTMSRVLPAEFRKQGAW